MNARLAIALSFALFALIALFAPGTAAAAWGPWARIEELEDELKSAKGTNATLEQQVSGLQAANAQCGREKAEVSIAAGRLEASLDEKLRWLEESQREVLNLSAQLAAAKAANDELIIRAETAERLFAGARSSINALREKVAQATARAEEAEMMLNAVSLRELSLQLDFNALQSMIGRLTGQIAELNEELSYNSRSNLVGIVSLALILSMSVYLLALKEKRRPAIAQLQSVREADLSNELQILQLSLQNARRRCGELEVQFKRAVDQRAESSTAQIELRRRLQSAEEEEKLRNAQLSERLQRAEERNSALTTLLSKEEGLHEATKTLIADMQRQLDAQTAAPTPPRHSGRKKGGAVKKEPKKEETPDNASANGAGEAPAEELFKLPPPSAVPAIDPHILHAVDEGPLIVIPTIELEEDGAADAGDSKADDIEELEAFGEDEGSRTPAQRFGTVSRPKTKKDTLH